MLASGITKSIDTPPSLEEEAYRSIRSSLVSGVFVPGDRLSIRKIAAALGTSPMPARSALRRLVAEQVLEVLPSGTAIVPLLTRASFIELTAIRTSLEPLAARMAAALIDDSALERLDHLLEGLARASTAGDVVTMLTANQQFMFEVYRAANAPLLMSMIETLWLRRGPMYWGLRDVFGKWRGPLPTVRHQATVAALRKRKGDEAAAAIHEEIDLTAAFLLQEIRFAGDPAPQTGIARLRPLRTRRPVRAADAGRAPATSG